MFGGIVKKILIIVLILLLLAGAGGGAYYYFFMMDTQEESVKADEEPESVMEGMNKEVTEPVEINMDYYVSSNKLNVRAYPKISAPIRSVLRKGKFVKALEVKGEWIRFSEYEVHQSGNDVADWINTNFLSHDKPVITELEVRKNMMKLVNKSDDFALYEDQFLIATKTLIDSEKCLYEDFELVGGWILSRTYNIEPVYFVYCGGTDTENKVYLNVETGEIFQP